MSMGFEPTNHSFTMTFSSGGGGGGQNNIDDTQVLAYKTWSSQKINSELEQKANLTVIAPQYSASATYAVGDVVIYNGDLYRCTTAITRAEAWNPAHWTAVSLAEASHMAATASTPGVIRVGSGLTISGYVLAVNPGTGIALSNNKVVADTATTAQVNAIISEYTPA